MGAEIGTPFESPVGSMMIWPTDTAPNGWLLCYGQAVSRTIYARLFALIATTFGIGDGSTTFNLPDLRGRIALGQDDMGGASANRVTNAQADIIGGSAGDEELAAHNHTIPQTTGDDTEDSYGKTALTTFINDVTGTTGTGANNMIPYLTTNYIIKF